MILFFFCLLSSSSSSSSAHETDPSSFPEPISHHPFATETPFDISFGSPSVSSSSPSKRKKEIPRPDDYFKIQELQEQMRECEKSGIYTPIIRKIGTVFNRMDCLGYSFLHEEPTDPMIIDSEPSAPSSSSSSSLSVPSKKKRKGKEGKEEIEERKERNVRKNFGKNKNCSQERRIEEREM
mmetsp:Transcript_7000/g.9405  ORF Transcript_7000/g.9405 Transcript_7000/m.9405 type:complete len:181 (+) Transcript_7000:135-677(+)